MSSHSDVLLRNSGLYVIKSYISDIGNDHDFEFSDMDSMKISTPNLERSVLEVDSEIKAENSVKGSSYDFLCSLINIVYIGNLYASDST